MKEIDNKFVSVMKQVHDEILEEDDSTTIIDDMLPREDESIIESLIRSRYVVSSKILDGIVNEDGCITPESVDGVFSERNWPIETVSLPKGIGNILDHIRSCTRRCTRNDDGNVTYHNSFESKDYGDLVVSDMHTITHAIVVGKSLMLSDPLLTDQDVENGLDRHIDRSYTILDAINYINESRHRLITWDIHHKGDDSPLTFRVRCILDRPIIDMRGLDTMKLGLQMYKEYREDDQDVFSHFMDIGVMELLNTLNVSLYTPIIRYAIELWKDYDNNHLMPNYFPDDMIRYMDNIRWSIYISAREYKDIINDIEEQDE